MKARLRHTVLFLFDAAAAALAVYCALHLRFDGAIPSLYRLQLPVIIPLFAAVRLGGLAALRAYGSLWRYATLREFVRAGAAVAVGTALLLPMSMWTPIFALPRSVFIIEGLLFGAAASIPRLFVRWYRVTHQGGQSPRGRRVLIVGAGDAGAMLAKEFEQQPWHGVDVVGFVDDDVTKVNRLLAGVPVLGTRQEIPSLVERHEVESVIIAMPSAPAHVVRETMVVCKEAGVALKLLPPLAQLVSDKVTVQDVRDVEIEDLLRRDPVETDLTAIRGYLQGKRVLVTGAGGSIGGELCRQVCGFEPAELILLDHSENSVFEIDLELRGRFPDANIVPVIADIRNKDKMNRVFARWRPEVVFHAAAHKHVPLMELNPEEAVANNVLGTRNVAEAAARFGAERFVMVSTDKAVNPGNVMGATKRLAELVVQSMQGGAGVGQASGSADRDFGSASGGSGPDADGRTFAPASGASGPDADGRAFAPASGGSGPDADGRAFASASGAPGPDADGRAFASASGGSGPTRFVSVRFGNVLGSRGSVIPLFREQIRQGGPVKVTHPDMTRYFMTIPEAVQLILQAAAMGRGGEVFVLDMGDPVRIADLAHDLIRLSGLEPGVDIEIQYTGVRPGEKLFEELVYDDETISPTSHDKVMALNGRLVEPLAVERAVRRLEQLLASGPARLGTALENGSPAAGRGAPGGADPGADRAGAALDPGADRAGAALDPGAGRAGAASDPGAGRAGAASDPGAGRAGAASDPGHSAAVPDSDPVAVGVGAWTDELVSVLYAAVGGRPAQVPPVPAAGGAGVASTAAAGVGSTAAVGVASTAAAGATSTAAVSTAAASTAAASAQAAAPAATGGSEAAAAREDEPGDSKHRSATPDVSIPDGDEAAFRFQTVAAAGDEGAAKGPS